MQIRALHLLLALILVPVANATTFSVNGHEGFWQADHNFSITYSQHNKTLHQAWFQKRIAPNHEIPLGDRSYWIPQKPDLAGKFHLVLDPMEASTWKEFLYTVDAPVLGLVYPELSNFVEKARPSMQRTLSALLEKLKAQNLTPAEKGEWFLDQTGHPVHNEETNQYFALANFLADDPEGGLQFALEGARKFQEAYPRLKARTPILKLPVSPLDSLRKPTLIVTHASEKWDAEQVAKEGINRIVAEFQARNWPVVFLMDDDGWNDRKWYTDSRQPTYALFSNEGEHDLRLFSADVTVVGGFFGNCQTLAKADAVVRHFFYSSAPLSIRLPMNAIYALNWRHSDYNTRTLSYIASAVGEERFLSFVRTTLFHPNSGPEPENFVSDERVNGKIDMEIYQFRVFLHGAHKFTVGQGTRVVELRFE